MIRRKLDNHWYIDRGVTKHMTFEKDLIVDFMKYEQPSKITELLKLMDKER